MNDLIHRDKVAEICAHRDAALDNYRRFFFAIRDAANFADQAKEHLLKACGGEVERHVIDTNRATEVEKFNRALQLPRDAQEMNGVARRLTDIQVWKALVKLTDLDNLMDKKAKGELARDLRYVPLRDMSETKDIPRVTVDNVEASIERFQEDAGLIWRRGIAEAFSNLDKRFRSHDGFSIGSRMVIERAFDGFGSWNFHSSHRNTLIDIERVFYVLDGSNPKEVSSDKGIVSVIDNERRNQGLSPRSSRHKGEFFRVNIFKNGNMHLWFTRPNLVKKVNLLLAEYYGAKLGTGKPRKHKRRSPFSAALERSPYDHLGEFFTPGKVADLVIDRACLYPIDDKPRKILEPSAGNGQLSKRALNAHGVKNIVVAYEIQPDLVSELDTHGYRSVVHGNFLEATPEKHYDRVIMNPPFDGQRDIDHVLHALQFLWHDGILIAVMSASAQFAQTKKAIEFRKLVKSLGGSWYDLPQGSFRESGTNVNTNLLRVKMNPSRMAILDEFVTSI